MSSDPVITRKRKIQLKHQSLAKQALYILELPPVKIRCEYDVEVYGSGDDFSGDDYDDNDSMDGDKDLHSQSDKDELC